MAEFDKDLLSKALIQAQGERTRQQFAIDAGISLTYMSRLIRKLTKGAPGPDVIKKLSTASRGKITYEKLMVICGHFTYTDPREHSLMGNMLLEDAFIESLAIIKDKSPDEMESQLRRILKYDVINVEGNHGDEWFINKIKEVMLSNNEPLEKNIVEADFLFSLDLYKDSVNTRNNDLPQLFLLMANAIRKKPSLINHIRDNKELMNLCVAETPPSISDEDMELLAIAKKHRDVLMAYESSDPTMVEEFKSRTINGLGMFPQKDAPPPKKETS